MISRSKAARTTKKKAKVSKKTINTEQDESANQPLKRGRGRPRKHPIPSQASSSKSGSNTSELGSTISQHQQQTVKKDETMIAPVFVFPPQFDFVPYLFQSKDNENTHSKYLVDNVNAVFENYWSGNSPTLLYDETDVFKYDLVLGLFKAISHTFSDAPPILIITASDFVYRWKTTFNEYHVSVQTENLSEKIGKSDILIVSADQEQEIEEFSKLNWSIIISDQIKAENFNIFDKFDVNRCLFICHQNSSSSSSEQDNVPPIFNESKLKLMITDDDLKANDYIEETIQFSTMTSQQILQTQQLFIANKPRLSVPSERLSQFLKQLITNLKTRAIHSLATQCYSPNDEISCKFPLLLSVTTEFMNDDSKVVILVSDPKHLSLVSSYFVAHQISTYKIDPASTRKKKLQIAEEYNISDSSTVLLIPPSIFVDILPDVNFNALIITDVEFQLLPNFDLLYQWNKRTQDRKPQIVRLLTASTIEPVLFEVFWEDRMKDFEKIESDELVKILKQSAELCFKCPNEVVPPITICYSEKEPIFTFNSEFGDDFWEQTVQIPIQQQQTVVSSSPEDSRKKKISSQRLKSKMKNKYILNDIDSDDDEDESDDDSRGSRVSSRTKKKKVVLARAKRSTTIMKTRKKPKINMADLSDEDSYDYDEYDSDTNSEVIKRKRKVVRDSSENDSESEGEDENAAYDDENDYEEAKNDDENDDNDNEEEEDNNKDDENDGANENEEEVLADTPQHTLAKPRKKFDSMIAYWNKRKFTRFLKMIREFGFDKWKKFECFGRNEDEYRKISALIVRMLGTTTKENRILREYFAKELRSSELTKIDAALPFISTKLNQLVIREEFLTDVTGMLAICKMRPKKPEDIVLPKGSHALEKPSEDWTDEDDRKLLFYIHTRGLDSIPPDFRHNLSRHFLKRFRTLYSVENYSPSMSNSPLSNFDSDNDNKNNGKGNNKSTKEKSKKKKKTKTTKKAKPKSSPSPKEIKEPDLNKAVVSKAKKAKINIKVENHTETDQQQIKESNKKVIQQQQKIIPPFDIKDHKTIINGLNTFGYPNPRLFKTYVNLNNVSEKKIDDYITMIFNFCKSTDSTEKKAIAQNFPTKVEKYTTKKIPERYSYFQKIREASNNYSDFSAEDIEFLSAISVHGLSNYNLSPVLLSSCYGECSENRLFQRIKTILGERQTRFSERLPEPLESILPMRLNDLQMLTSLGEIDPRFCTKDYVYPIGYECVVGCSSPYSSDEGSLIWLKAFVRLAPDQSSIQFVVKKNNSSPSSFEYVDSSPDLVFEKIRQRVIKRTKTWIPLIDGHEMFGFNSAKFHRLLIEMPNIGKCTEYQRRFFRAPLTVVHEWPKLGIFEPPPERTKNSTSTTVSSGASSTSAAVVNDKGPGSPNLKDSSRFTYRKRDFGDILRPISIDFSPLFSDDPKDAVINVSMSRPGGADFNQLMKRYEMWDIDIISKYLPNNEKF